MSIRWHGFTDGTFLHNPRKAAFTPPNYPTENAFPSIPLKQESFFLPTRNILIVLYKSKPRINQIRNLKSFLSPTLQVQHLGVVLAPHINFRENTRSAESAADTHGHHRMETSGESCSRQGLGSN